MLFDDLSPLMQWFLAHLIVQSGNDEIAGDIRENGANIVLTGRHSYGCFGLRREV